MGLLDGNIGEFVAEANSTPNSLPSGDRAKIQVLRGSSSAADIAKNLAWGEFALGKGTDGYDLWIGGKNENDANDAQKVVLAHEFDTKIRALKEEIIDNIGEELDAAIKYVGGTVIIGAGDGDNSVTKVEIRKETTINEGLTVEGSTTIGTTDAAANLTVKGNATVEGTSTLKGATTIGTDPALENLTVTGKAKVTGEIESGSLKTGGITSLDIDVTGDIDVTNGNITTNKNINANSGTVSASTLQSSNVNTTNVTATGDISAKNVTATEKVSAKEVEIGPSSTTEGSLTVNGGATVTGAASVTGEIESGSVKTGSAVIGDATAKDGSLTVNGGATITNDLTIQGSLKIEGTGGITQVDPTTLTTADNFLELNVNRNPDGSVIRNAAVSDSGGLIIHGKSDKDFALKYDSTSEKVDFVFGTNVDEDGNLTGAGSSVLTLDQTKLNIFSGAVTLEADKFSLAGNKVNYDGAANTFAVGNDISMNSSTGVINASEFNGSVDGGEF